MNSPALEGSSHHNEGNASHSSGCCCVGSSGKDALFCCQWDNAAVEAIVSSGGSAVDRTMHLMQCFFLLGSLGGDFDFPTHTMGGGGGVLMVPPMFSHETCYLPFSG